MTNNAVVENKISAIRKYLKILERYKKYSQEEIENDIDLRGALERYLYLAVQATIDLADAAVSAHKLRKPTTMNEAFYVLEENNIIEKDLLEKMVQMTGFRNIVAHDYEKIDYNIVYDILQNKLEDIESFIRKIEKL